LRIAPTERQPRMESSSYGSGSHGDCVRRVASPGFGASGRSLPPTHGNGSRPQLPSVRRESSRHWEVQRGPESCATAACNMPAVPR
jgi:hypothetical protein